jgi:dephospho-CoA kinase
MVYCIGLTGNVASGKSTVAKLFSDLGIQIISADTHSKRLTAKGMPCVEQIAKHFGETVLHSDGSLNRKQLRHIVFNHPSERAWLEQLLHPLIRQSIEQEVKDCKTPYCIIEIPLLINKAHYPYLNRILVVMASEEDQIQRVMKRDQSSREQAKAILATQPTEMARKEIADDVIINDSDIDHLQHEVNRLHNIYLSCA